MKCNEGRTNIEDNFITARYSKVFRAESMFSDISPDGIWLVMGDMKYEMTPEHAEKLYAEIGASLQEFYMEKR